MYIVQLFINLVWVKDRERKNQTNIDVWMEKEADAESTNCVCLAEKGCANTLLSSRKCPVVALSFPNHACQMQPTNFRFFTIIFEAIILNEIAATIATATITSTESTSVTLIAAFEAGLKQRQLAG